jgi:hypothetical protein
MFELVLSIACCSFQENRINPCGERPRCTITSLTDVKHEDPDMGDREGVPPSAGSGSR